MRFRGGGVGHRVTRERTEAMSQEVDTTVLDENEDNFEDDKSYGDGEELEEDEGSSESGNGILYLVFMDILINYTRGFDETLM